MKRVGVVFAVLTLLAACQQSSSKPSAPASPSPQVSPSSPPSTLLEAVEAGGILEHLRALQRIAERNGGSRAAGTPGYNSSVRYVVRVLRDAGLNPRIDAFTAPVFDQAGPSKLQVAGRSFRDGRDFRAMLYSASGAAQGPLATIGYKADAAGLPSPGCTVGAFEDAPPGAIVLLQPGPCFTRDQVANAQAAGAGGVIVAYPSFERGGVLRPTLITPEGMNVPVVAAADQVGDALAEKSGATVGLRTRTRVREVSLRNVIAETGPGGEPGTIMVGGHLDSVIDGPGINDNGSGVGTILALADALADERLKHTVRFGFWAGEELGLLGSTHYVATLDRGEIDSYINLDMVASPNFVTFVYDEPQAPAGSDRIAQLFFDFFEERGLPATALNLEGRSDHGAFAQAGVATGGVFSGAEELKTAQQEQRYGGTVGNPLDPCYHEACDTTANINERALDQLSDAAAYVVMKLAVAR